MKTFIGLVFIISAVVILVSCENGSSSENATQSNDVNISEITVETQKTEVTADIETDITEDNHESDIVHESISDVLGTINGNVYENKKLSLGFRLPDNNWCFQNTEQHQYGESVGEDIFGVNPSEELPKVGTAFSAVCTSGESGGDTVYLSYQSAPSDIVMPPLEEGIDSIRGLPRHSSWQEAAKLPPIEAGDILLTLYGRYVK